MPFRFQPMHETHVRVSCEILKCVKCEIGPIMRLLIVLSVCSFVNGEARQCAKLLAKAANQDRNTIVETSVKTLSGVWLSESCETRPGPEYVLRHYTFEENGNYKLIQHHYWDNSCSSPKLSIVAIGLLKTKRDSFLHHDALTGYSKPSNITVIPQDAVAAKELDGIVSNHCPGQYWKTWRRYEEHLVFTNPKDRHHLQQLEFERIQETLPNTQHYLQNSSGAITCLGDLRWSFNELNLIKVQLRPNQHGNGNEMHWELLLGDIPSRKNLMEHYMPTGFQIPLVKTSKGNKEVLKGRKFFVKYTCSICSNLASNERSPPHLIEKPRLPAYIGGEWVSERCEVRPMGLYLTRHFTFHNEDLRWMGEHRFYVDPFCTLRKFTVTASGTFEMNDGENPLKEASNIEFKIEKAPLVIYDQGLIEYMPWENCGKLRWKIGVGQELAETGGCEQLGIIIPSVQYDIVKMEMSYQGLWLLFLGQADTENSPRDTPLKRPTAFQVPLVRCGEAHSQHLFNSDYEDSGQPRTFATYIQVVLVFVTLNF
uniref:APCDD1 domain-containing protein n=1 Tax=Photinus pyralis TaxID=7054 RepID=A0A1Y1L181_PHOPY